MGKSNWQYAMELEVTLRSGVKSVDANARLAAVLGGCGSRRTA